MLVNLCCGWGPSPKALRAWWWPNGPCQWTQGPDRSKALMPCCCSDLIGPDAGVHPIANSSHGSQTSCWAAEASEPLHFAIRISCYLHPDRASSEASAVMAGTQTWWVEDFFFGSQWCWCLEDLWNAKFWYVNLHTSADWPISLVWGRFQSHFFRQLTTTRRQRSMQLPNGFNEITDHHDQEVGWRDPGSAPKQGHY